MKKILCIMAALLMLTGCGDSPYKAALRDIEKAWDNGDSAAAVSVAESYLREYPDSVDVPERAADCCFQNDDYVHAEALYYDVCSKKPTAERIRKYLEAMAHSGALDGFFDIPREDITVDGMRLDEYIEAKKTPREDFSHEPRYVRYSAIVDGDTDVWLPFGLTAEHTGTDILLAGGMTAEQADILSYCTEITLSKPFDGVSVSAVSDNEKAIKPTYAPVWKITLQSGDVELTLTYSDGIGGKLREYVMKLYYSE